MSLLKFSKSLTLADASINGSFIPCAIRTGPIHFPSFTEEDSLALPKSAPRSSFPVLGGGNLDPEIITAMAPGSSESLRIESHSFALTAAGFVGYKFTQIDSILGRKYQSKPLPNSVATGFGGGLSRCRRERRMIRNSNNYKK